MIWEDERYVRVYTRDTPEWLALSFDAQALFLLLLRKVDRAGLLPLGKVGRKAVAHITGHGGEWKRLEPALDELLADGCAKIVGDTLSIPNFIAAQEAITTGAQRTRDWRERSAAQKLAEALRRDETSHHVTTTPPPGDATSQTGDETSHFVTRPNPLVTRPPTVVTPSFCTVPPKDLSGATRPRAQTGEPEQLDAEPDPSLAAQEPPTDGDEAPGTPAAPTAAPPASAEGAEGLHNQVLIPDCNGTAFDRLTAIWNSVCVPAGFARAHRTPKQERAARTRVREPGWLDAFRAACAYAASEPFYRGGSSSGWCMTFGWLLQAGNSEKTAEKASTHRATGPPGRNGGALPISTNWSRDPITGEVRTGTVNVATGELYSEEEERAMMEGRFDG